MASAIIHMCVAKKVNEVLKVDNKPYMLGSIAPDVAKMVGLSRIATHFVTKENSDIPDINFFIKKYRNELNNPFELGYLVHLITDVLWFDEFLPNFIDDNYIVDNEGNKIKFTPDELTKVIYNDYTNLNVKLVEYYNLDYSLFYEQFDLPESHIDEMPSIYFGTLIDKMGTICSNMEKYNYMLNIESITHFIEYATIYVIDELKKYNIIKNAL